MIKSIKFYGLRISEMVEFFALLVAICKKYATETLNISVQVNALEASFNESDAVFKQDRASEYTAELVKLDQLRDDDLICLRKIAEGFTYHFLPGKKAAARLISKTINLYGKSVQTLNYEAETTVVRNLCNDLLTKPELQQAIESLPVVDVIENLKSNNESFSELYLQRVDETSKKKDAAAGEALKETINVYRELASHIDANMVVSPSAELGELVDEINTLGDRYNDIVELRKGRK